MIENGWMDGFVVVFFFVFVSVVAVSKFPVVSLVLFAFLFLFCYCVVFVVLFPSFRMRYFVFFWFRCCIVNVLCIYRPLYTIHGLKATLTGLSGGVVVWCCLV